MQTAKSMTLHLQQAISYKRAPFDTSEAEHAYQQLLSFLDSAEVGSEGCLALTSTLSLLFAGIQDPPTEEIRNRVEQGLEMPPHQDPHQIEPGTYTFIQLAVPEHLRTLVDQIPMLFDGPNRIYVRLLKENALAIVAQMWISR
jgi:hypothetical protein